jgi:hypothetical protein
MTTYIGKSDHVATLRVSEIYGGGIDLQELGGIDGPVILFR